MRDLCPSRYSSYLLFVVSSSAWRASLILLRLPRYLSLYLALLNPIDLSSLVAYPDSNHMCSHARKTRQLVVLTLWVLLTDTPERVLASTQEPTVEVDFESTCDVLPRTLPIQDWSSVTLVIGWLMLPCTRSKTICAPACYG